MTAQPTHSLLPPLGAALPEHPELLESLVYQLNGLVVVFLALGMIWGLLEAVGVFFRQRTPATVPPAVTTTASDSKATTDDRKPAPEISAAIAAAVHVCLGVEHRIASIVPVDVPTHDWALEGRRQIHSARKVR